MPPPAPTGEQFTISSGTASATIVEVGGGLRAFEVDGLPVLDGYGVEAMAPSGRGQVLIPWPNRLDHGHYVWNGEDQQLPVNEIERANAIHGLVRFSSWRCVSRNEDRVELQHTLWPQPGYPFTLDIRIAYQIENAGLIVTTVTHNVGAESAPFGSGQHPYLLPPPGIAVDDCRLVVPAATYLQTDDRGLPSGSQPVEGTRFDFRAGRPIGTIELDTAFTDLIRDADGKARIRIAGRGRTVELWLDAGYPYVQVFTGDTVPAPRQRTSVAVEPMTCPPNAFATGIDLVRLAPNETFTATWGIVVPVPGHRFDEPPTDHER